MNNNESFYRVKIFLANGDVDTFSSDSSFSSDYGMITWQIDDEHSITYPVASIFKIEETEVIK